MFGIIAVIIAACKKHTTFAWVVGIWTAIAIILYLSGAEYVFFPGILFMIIAICMKKPDSSGTGSKGTVNMPPDSMQPVNPSQTINNYYYPVVPDKNLSADNENSPETNNDSMPIRFCRYCGQELSPDTKFCRNCGANIQ